MGTSTRLRLASVAIAIGACALTLHCGTDGTGTTFGASGICGEADSDGLTGGSYTEDLQVDDTAFAPIILKAQNLATVTLTLKNAGSRPHDFVVDCMPTPNDNGCPATSCFPDASAIGALAPDASATSTFATPNPEGIYTFRSDLPGDTQSGQFIVQ
jgi:hypothetical protein